MNLYVFVVICCCVWGHCGTKVDTDNTFEVQFSPDAEIVYDGLQVGTQYQWQAAVANLAGLGIRSAVATVNAGFF